MRVNISIKNLVAIQALSPYLMDVLRDVADLWPGPELYVTSLNRTPQEDAALGASGVHSAGPPWRAIDLRITNLGEGYQEIAEDVANKVNALWEYDPRRPQLKVAFARLHGSGPHIHLQVHPRTRRA